MSPGREYEDLTQTSSFAARSTGPRCIISSGAVRQGHCGSLTI
jgi:hypothetical protein